jgi:type II secretory pathway component PulM
MNELLAPLRSYLKSRSPRERWILVAGACVLALVSSTRDRRRS